MNDNVNTIAGWTLFAGIVALGLSIEIFIVTRLVTESFPAGLAIAAAVLCVLLGLWVVLPRWRQAPPPR